MTPMTALPGRPADATVQGAARPGRASSVREDLGRSRDEFARTLERETSRPERSSTRGTDTTASAGARRAAARDAAQDATVRDDADSTRATRPVAMDQAVRDAARAGALDNGAPSGDANAAVAATPHVVPGAAEVVPVVVPAVATDLAVAVPAETTVTAEPVAAPPEDGAVETSLTTAVPVLAAGAPAVAAEPTLQSGGPAAASAAQTLAQTAAQTAAGATSALGTPGVAAADPQPAAAPLVIEGSQVVVTAAVQPGAAAVAQRDAGPTVGAPAVTAAAAADAGPKNAPATETVVRTESAPAGPASTPITPSAATFAQVLTGATDRVAAQAPAAPANTPHVPLAEQVRGPLVALRTAAPGEHMLTLRVDPESLGPVQVRAHIGADGIRIELVGATDAARDSLRGLLTDLRRDLSATGMNATLSLAADTAGQQSRTPAGNGDLFGGQQRAPGQGDTQEQGGAQRTRAASAWTSPDQTTDARTTASTAHGAHGVDVLV